jgi:hypothetical protein
MYRPCGEWPNHGKKPISGSIQYPQWWKDTAIMRECVQQSSSSCYSKSSLFRDPLYHFLLAYNFFTLWTQCNELCELLAYCIEKKLQELLMHCTECLLHYWNAWNINHNQPILWSRQSSRNTMECNSVAPIVALHTAQPTHEGSWFQIAGVSLFTLYALWVEAYHCHKVVLQHLHWALDTKTPPFRISFAKDGRLPPDDSIIAMVV